MLDGGPLKPREYATKEISWRERGHARCSTAGLTASSSLSRLLARGGKPRKRHAAHAKALVCGTPAFGATASSSPHADPTYTLQAQCVVKVQILSKTA